MTARLSLRSSVLQKHENVRSENPLKAGSNLIGYYVQPEFSVAFFHRESKRKVVYYTFLRRV
jgi:hypothetical protein